MNAIEYAVSLFKDEKCEFHVLNVQKASAFVTDDFMAVSSSATVYNTIIDAAKRSIQNLIVDIQKKYKNDNHEFLSIVDYDNFIDAINQISEDKNIDLIVMGTKGATGAAKVVFGSNTARVMQRCFVPVLAIPDNCSYNGIDKIGFTSNYSTKYQLDELRALTEIAKQEDSRIHVIHLMNEMDLSQDQKNNKEFLDKCIGTIDHKFVDLESEDMFDTIHDYIEAHEIKMLAMMSRKHSFLERLFARHLVETFVFKIDIPFLVMENTGEQY
jgi:nucleotide-binding universal stress UspA family protein